MSLAAYNSNRVKNSSTTTADDRRKKVKEKKRGVVEDPVSPVRLRRRGT